MFCSLSGQPCRDPVISPAGYVYERAVITKHLASDSTDPIAHTPLEEHLLVSVRAPADPSVPSSRAVAPPKPPSATSIPSLLRSLQAEWDASVLDAHQLRTQNARLRQELARALYQTDAAARVIARLVAEKDAVAADLAAIKRAVREGGPVSGVSAVSAPVTSANTTTAADEEPAADRMDVDEPATVVTAGVQAEFDAVSDALSKTRKKRKSPVTASHAALDTFAPHSHAEVTHAGIAHLTPAYAGHPSTDPSHLNADPAMVVVGGPSRGLLMIDPMNSNATTAAITFPGALKTSKVAAAAVVAGPDASAPAGSDEATALVRVVAAIKDRVLLASPTKILADVPVARGEGKHGAVVGFAVHPSGHYAAAVTSGGAVHLLKTTDDAALEAVHVVQLPSSSSAGDNRNDVPSSVAFHPDGMLLAVSYAQSGRVAVIHPTTGAVVAMFDAAADEGGVDSDVDEATRGGVTAVHFSEIGFQLFAARAGGGVDVWDLRKLARAAVLATSNSVGVTAVVGDYTGTYVAAGLADGSVKVWAFEKKQWAAVAEVAAVVGGDVTGLAWGQDAKTLVVGGKVGGKVVALQVSE
ncbi:Prp19/Pso4-like-domain-containing protein [Blastocladiella britannica]|nr:Prp19/Pso4-like-domain-containing protein [Blastocladiella britannica]